MPEINPSRTLAVILGASTFPDAPTLAAGRAFYISADDVRQYLRDGLAVPDQRILWLFDDSRSPSDQLRGIGDFLERSTRQTEGDTPENLLIYYVGHGLFGARDQAYSLAIRYTMARDEGSTSLRAEDLAGTIRNSASFLRRFLIFDCCFAGAINKEFQSGALHAARTKIASEFPTRGTALLCSSNATDASLAPQGLERTMFSFALIEALRNGHQRLGDRFSFSELGDLVKETLRQRFTDSFVRPEVHSPDQREGDIADLALFPNPSYRVREARHKAARLPVDLYSKPATVAADEPVLPAHEKVQPEGLRRERMRRPASSPPVTESVLPSVPAELRKEVPVSPPPATEKEHDEKSAAPETATPAPVVQLPVSSEALDFKVYRASLPWFRRVLLLYKPPRMSAWLPRIFFYWTALALPFSTYTGGGSALLGTIIICWVLYAVSVWLEKPK